MTIEQLVKELESPVYKSEEKKIALLKRHLKVDYVDYLAKIDLCRQILFKSMYVEIDGKETYKPDSPLRYALTISAYLQAYYDFELSNVFMKDLNLLEKNNLTELIIRAIGSDIERLNVVMKMMVDDLDYANSLVPYLSTKTEAIGVALDSLVKAFEVRNIEEKSD